MNKGNHNVNKNNGATNYQHEDKIKHLEFIEANISRMNHCSSQLKGWTITIVSALLAVFATSLEHCNSKVNVILIFVGMFPALFFWILDSTYLQTERKFRGMYNSVANLEEKKEIKTFSFPFEDYHSNGYSLLEIVFSKSEFIFYFPIITLLLAGGLVYYFCF